MITSLYIAYINPSCSAFITAKKGNQFAKKQQLVESCPVYPVVCGFNRIRKALNRLVYVLQLLWKDFHKISILIIGDRELDYPVIGQ